MSTRTYVSPEGNTQIGTKNSQVITNNNNIQIHLNIGTFFPTNQLGSGQQLPGLSNSQGHPEQVLQQIEGMIEACKHQNGSSDSPQQVLQQIEDLITSSRQQNEYQRDQLPAEYETPLSQPEAIPIIDSDGQELQAGDIVCVGSIFSCYCALYLGNMEVIRCDPMTQKVERKELDIRKPFRRYDHAISPRRILAPEERIRRALSCVGGQPPVRETSYGLDFIYWTYTGLIQEQLLENGFVFIQNISSATIFPMMR